MNHREQRKGKRNDWDTLFFLRTKSIRMLENPKKTKNIAKKIERPHLGFKKKIFF